MILKEYGDKSKATIILLHGGGLSWWNYRDVNDILKNDYHVIMPILDGHANSDKHFTSIEDNAKEIIDFIDNNLDGHVLLICGLSLGAQILIEILSERDNICDYAIIESALVIPMKLTSIMIRPAISMSYSLISKRWFSKLQFKSLKINNTLFDDYYRDTRLINKEDMISFLKASTSYQIKGTLKRTKAKVLIAVGSKENNVMK